MTVAVYGLLGLLALAALPTLVFVVEVLAALPRARRGAAVVDPSLRVAVLVPAHDEEAGIAATLATIRPQLREGDRLVVVADNCSDATADVARAAGADVFERSDDVHRGKSFAIASGVTYLAANEPDIVIVVDADCRVEAGAIDALRAAAVERPAQAAYVMRAPDGAPPSRRLAELMFLVRNVVRPLGLQRLGVPCLLTGAGMAFPWSLIRGAALASGSVVEDLQLAVDLAADGTPPRFCGAARVTSLFPTGEAAAGAQQTRWLWGVTRAMAQAPRLVLAALRHRQPSLIALAAELAVPPLTMLFALWMLAIAGALAVGLVAHEWRPLAGAGLGLGVCVLAIVMAWLRFARDRVPASVLLGAPLYALPAMRAALASLLRRRQEWNRTARD
ncbi:MAG TPA: glycosyltransferase family 2 protein [Polyangia bacterium]|nr:glycosyltransferase family 2 protein [Polyangia bacterium]